MKKSLKIIVSVILIVLTLFGFAAKYWTNGIYPGMRGADVLPESIDTTFISRCPYYFFRNSLGQTVIVRLTSGANTSGSGNFTFNKYLYSQYGQIVTRVHTAPPALATHGDFLNLANKRISMFQLIAMAGMPTKTYYVKKYGTHLDFKTIDGYTYHVCVLGIDWFGVRCITDPYGNVIEGEAREIFLNKVELFYIFLLVFLIAFLACLLTIPSAIRRRKAAEDTNDSPDPAEKATRKRRVLKNALCIAVVLATLIAYDAKYQTHGARPSLEYAFQQYRYTAAALGSEDKILGGGGQLVSVYQNAYGRTVLSRRSRPIGSEFNKKIYSIFGGINTEVQTFSDNIATHLDFFFAHRSPRQFSQLLRSAGMPDRDVVGNFADFDFDTIDGYTYRVRASYDGTAHLLGVIDPEGNQIYKDEDLDAFMVKILIAYLGIAAALGVALVVLIKVPKVIRKRKEAAN